MKKLKFLSIWIGICGLLLGIPLVVSLLFSGSNLVTSKLPIEMIAYNSLTEQESSLIVASPKDSSVKKVRVTDDIKSLIDSNYDKNIVYSVTFNHTKTDSSGDLVVFVDLDKETVVGKGFSDQ